MPLDLKEVLYQPSRTSSDKIKLNTTKSDNPRLQCRINSERNELQDIRDQTTGPDQGPLESSRDLIWYDCQANCVAKAGRRKTRKVNIRVTG